MTCISRTVLTSMCTFLLVACSSNGSDIDVEEVTAGNDTPTDIISDTDDDTEHEIIEISDPVIVDSGTQRLTFNDNQQELNADISTSSQFAITNDNRYLLFSTTASNVLATGDSADSFTDVYLRDTVAGSVTKISQAIADRSNDGRSLSEDISDDGRYSVFTGFSTGIHPEANGSNQVYLYDALSQSSTLISRTPTGDAGRGNSDKPFITANGDTIVFTSRAQNINRAFSGRTASIFTYDVATGITTELELEPLANNLPFVTGIDVSPDARFILFKTISGNTPHYFVIDRTTNNLTAVPDDITSEFGLRISDNGRYLIAQNSDSTERPVVWIDLQQNIRVEPDIDTLVPNWAGPEFRQTASPEEISADGQTILYYGVLFDGQSPVTSDNVYWNIYALDITQRDAVLVSRGIDQNGGNNRSIYPQFSNNEQSIVYYSDASNLVAGDNNFHSDVFTTSLQYEKQGNKTAVETFYLYR